MAIDWKAQEALNTEHTIRPQPCDYWHEMFCPVLLVVWTDGEHVEYLDSTEHHQDCGDGRWTFNTDKPLVRRTVEEFAERLHYQSQAMRSKCWCDVIPKNERLRPIVAAALETRRRVAP